MLRVHSMQTLGTLDGPGVRFVVFTQGCPLRCACCHNPDTWDARGGKDTGISELVQKCLRYREYFGAKGGITVSGGEPLMQAKAVHKLFEKCKAEGINTCLDTSGCVLNDDVKELLTVTDRVLLDIKYTNDTDYRRYTGWSMDAPMEFLHYLNEKSIPTTLRQVIIPTLNDSEESIARLKAIKDAHPCADGVELLAFRKLCESKYQTLGIPFPLTHLKETSPDTIKKLTALL